jgi:hypothetical protein
VSSNPAQTRCTRYHIMWSSLTVTCGMSVVFYGYSGFLPNKTVRHDITEILLKVALNTITLIILHLKYISRYFHLDTLWFMYINSNYILLFSVNDSKYKYLLSLTKTYMLCIVLTDRVGCALNLLKYSSIALIKLRRVWRYQRGNQNP